MYWKLIPIWMAVVVILVASGHSAVDRVGWALLNEGSHYVVLLRHAHAPGEGEPDSFRLDDCSTQRGLSEKGREEARLLGEIFREGRIRVGKVVASQWCRARETAELMKIGKVEHEPAFDNLEFNKRRGGDPTDLARAFIGSWHGPGVLVAVTHSSNLKALTGVQAAQSGIVLVSPAEKSMRFRPLALIPPNGV
jgi:phosphohistidine phosphatase SixA